MKVSEMTENQSRVYHLVVKNCDEYFGSCENTLYDFSEGSEEYERAKKNVTKDSTEICKDIELWCRREWEKDENLHFVGLDFLRQRIVNRVNKELRNFREQFPEIF